MDFLEIIDKLNIISDKKFYKVTPEFQNELTLIRKRSLLMNNMN